MKRRTLLLGLTAATAGITGTGAFSTARVEREANISVTNDADSLLGLVPNDRVAGVREIDGQLTIALDQNGVNVDSAYQFGTFIEDDDVVWENLVGGFFDPILYEDAFSYEDNFRSAFAVVNKTETPREVEMDLSISDDDGEAGNAARPEIYFQIHYGDTILDSMSVPNTLSSMTVLLDPGSALGVSFAIDATDSSVDDSLSGTLSVRSEASEE